MEELEGRMASNAHRQLVRSAVDGGMNTLRVWGGGIFLPRAWYEACDELGIMVYHDMQYSHGHGSPINDQTQVRVDLALQALSFALSAAAVFSFGLSAFGVNGTRCAR